MPNSVKEIEIFKKITKYYIVLGSVILIVSIYFVVIAKDLELYISFLWSVNVFLSIIGSMIALYIPIYVIGLNRMEKKNEEKKEMIVILERIKQYLNYWFQRNLKPKSSSIGLNMPYFASLSRNKPHLLIKIGIEISDRVVEGTNYVKMFIVDKYCLSINYSNVHITLGNSTNELQRTKEHCNEILNDIREYARRFYGIELAEKFFKM